MRRTRVALALVASLLLFSTACAREITGTARPDPTRPPVAIVQDGYGIKIGFDDAPVQLEIYTEPQCNHCADLQADFGDQIRSYIGLGELAVTYRPLTFLDTETNLHSERVANAMFAAATAGGPENTATDGPAFQRFVEAAWKHYGDGPDRPSTDELAEMASTEGVPAYQVSQIKAGGPAVDVRDLQEFNFEFLYEIDPVNTGTPTVFDLNTGEKLDVYDDWLSKVMES